MRAIALALRQRNLRLLLAAGLISLTGDWILRTGLAYAVYALTGDTLASALTVVASFVPQILLGSPAGVFVDRWDLRRTMVVTNLLLAVGLLPLLAVHDRSQLWIVYGVTVWQGCVQQFFEPAAQSLLPRLVPDRQLVTANALNGQNADLSRLLGAALGGVAAAAGGITLVALLDAASFLCGAQLMAAIRVPSAPPPPTAARPPLPKDWLAGLRLTLRHPVLRGVLAFLLVTSVGEGIMSTLFAPFVRSVLHAGASAYGVIGAAQAVGGLAGGLCAAALGERLRGLPALAISAVAFGLTGLAIFLYPTLTTALWPAVTLMVVAGVPGAFVLTSAMTLLQQHSTDSHRGRVFGALGTVQGAAVVTGTVAAGLLAGPLGIVPVLAVQGAGYVAAGLLVVLVAGRRPTTIPS
ncbi:MFS transporter [Kitasatospora sp. NPDC006697]|uniref:MFS transporter n=1 Tax=Kitasatospora sp. NPDC006697 TaxID=3364020 RepID=UPI0036C5E9FD